MLKIILVCNNGMSTAMMAKKMNEKSDGYCYVEMCIRDRTGAVLHHGTYTENIKLGLLRKARPDHLDEGADMGLFFVQ